MASPGRHPLPAPSGGQPGRRTGGRPLRRPGAGWHRGGGAPRGGAGPPMGGGRPGRGPGRRRPGEALAPRLAGSGERRGAGRPRPRRGLVGRRGPHHLGAGVEPHPRGEGRGGVGSRLRPGALGGARPAGHGGRRHAGHLRPPGVHDGRVGVGRRVRYRGPGVGARTPSDILFLRRGSHPGVGGPAGPRFGGTPPPCSGAPDARGRGPAPAIRHRRGQQAVVGRRPGSAPTRHGPRFRGDRGALGSGGGPAPGSAGSGDGWGTHPGGPPPGRAEARAAGGGAGARTSPGRPATPASTGAHPRRPARRRAGGRPRRLPTAAGGVHPRATRRAPHPAEWAGLESRAAAGRDVGRGPARRGAPPQTRPGPRGRGRRGGGGRRGVDLARLQGSAALRGAEHDAAPGHHARQVRGPARGRRGPPRGRPGSRASSGGGTAGACPGGRAHVDGRGHPRP